VEIAGLNSVDWVAPWLAPIATRGRAISASVDWRGALSQAAAEADLRSSTDQRITFCEADAAGDEPYEAFIARTGRVPTRANLHDLFNALIFLHYPHTKARLNQLQSAALAHDGVQATRGPVRDAATLIDENAALLVTLRADLVETLRRHDWPTLFKRQRAAWSEISVLAFGHALLEKLVRPYKAITAHALHVALAPDTPLTEVDRYVAATLDDDLSPQRLLSLPVLGIPGWCAQNEDPSFYADTKVFRPDNIRRKSKAEAH
jgi:Protein of unknown function (DUF3025)